MKVKATVSFSGQVSAASGEVFDLPDGSPVLKDLLRAGYVVSEGAKAKKAPRGTGVDAEAEAEQEVEQEG